MLETAFAHDKLEVYALADEYLALADQVAGELPRGRAYVVDQLRRAALSIVCNIAEGAGEFSPGDKARFYRMARRSGTECAAIHRGCVRLGLARAELTEQALRMLNRILAMLTVLIVRLGNLDET